MKRLAIIVAVSAYSDQQDLIACKNDGAAIHSLISATQRFDDILMLSTPRETEGARAQDAFASFVDKYRQDEVAEVLFYFTGHGAFDGENLDLLLSDYTQSKRKQTSFQNAELDATIRGLSPELYVKIIDACQSGVSYVKSYETFNEYLKGSSSGLKNVYFMFSSNSDQSSYASKDMSYFTKSLVKSVAHHSTEKLRYKDIVNAISDEYESNQKQTPFFVTQAAMTETFADLNPEIRKIAKSFLNEGTKKPSKRSNDKQTKESLAEKIKKAEDEIASESEAMAKLTELSQALSEPAQNSEVSELFAWSAAELDDLPDGTLHIGKWLESNDIDGNFFCKKTYKSESYSERVPKRSNFLTTNWARLLWNQIDDIDDDRNYKTVIRSRSVVDGFEHTVDLAYDAIRVWLEPKLKALTPEQCIVIPLVSRTHFQVFWRFAHFRYTDWENTEATTRSGWNMALVPIRHETTIKDVSKTIRDGFESYVLSSLKTKWGITKDSVVESEINSGAIEASKTSQESSEELD